MTNQRINDIETITTFSGTDRLLVNTDVVNNVLEQIEKDDFIADIISTDSGNAIEVGTDKKIKTKSTITLQGNTFNGNSQLIQTTAAGKYPALDGSLITGVGATIDKNITQIGTCSTASATAEKAVTLNGFVLTTGITIQVTFTNANTAVAPTLNVNSTGAKAIYNEGGTAVSATNPAYFPAGSTVEFTYNGTYWIFKKRVIENYVNGTSWYRIYTDGWIEQGGINTFLGTGTTITLVKSYKNLNFNLIFGNTPLAPGFYAGGVAENPSTKTINTFTAHGWGSNQVLAISSTWETKGY